MWVVNVLWALNLKIKVPFCSEFWLSEVLPKGLPLEPLAAIHA